MRKIPTLTILLLCAAPAGAEVATPQQDKTALTWPSCCFAVATTSQPLFTAVSGLGYAALPIVNESGS